MIKPNKPHTNIRPRKSVCIKFVKGNFIRYKNKYITYLSKGSQTRGLILKVSDKFNNIFQPREIYFY